MELSFDQIDDLFDEDFCDEDFGNEDFGIDSNEYFDNEEYIDKKIEIEEPVLKKPILKPVLKSKTNVKPRNFSYDDILKSMNVTVINGKLVLSKGNNTINHENTINYENTHENTSKKVKFSEEQIPHEVKNSAIYNKYFKTYNNIQPTIEVRRPKTIEEYRQMLLEDKIKRIQAKRRIDMIKPKTLLFSRENTPIINISQPTNLNKLFNFPR
jgi:hypothetical protein